MPKSVNEEGEGINSSERIEELKREIKELEKQEKLEERRRERQRLNEERKISFDERKTPIRLLIGLVVIIILVDLFSTGLNLR